MKTSDYSDYGLAQELLRARTHIPEIMAEAARRLEAHGKDRASHGQAPAGATEPTEQQILEAAEKAGLWPNTVHSWIPAFHRYHKELAKAQPAPAQADSVQEDAADPLQGAANWLAEAHGQFSPVILSGCLMIGYNRAKRLHDAAIAARKQGATNDR